MTARCLLPTRAGADARDASFRSAPLLSPTPLARLPSGRPTPSSPHTRSLCPRRASVGARQRSLVGRARARAAKSRTVKLCGARHGSLDARPPPMGGSGARMCALLPFSSCFILCSASRFPALEHKTSTTSRAAHRSKKDTPGAGGCPRAPAPPRAGSRVPAPLPGPAARPSRRGACPYGVNRK